jgi:hypothetical protein
MSLRPPGDIGSTDRFESLCGHATMQAHLEERKAARALERRSTPASLRRCAAASQRGWDSDTVRGNASVIPLVIPPAITPQVRTALTGLAH